MSAEISTLGRLAVSAIVANSGTPSDPNLLVNFSSFAKGVGENIADGNMLRGELSRRVNRVRTTHFAVAPTLNMEPTAVELARILDWAMGTAPSGTSYTLGNDVRKAKMMYDDNNTVWVYDELAVSSLSLSSSENDPILKAGIQLLGKRCDPAGTFPSGLSSSVVDGTTQPFIHSDTTVSGVSQILLGGTATMVQSIEIEIDNGLDPNRFFNSQYLTGFVKNDRNIQVKITYPYGEYPSLYASAAAENAGITVVATYTCNNTSLVLTFPCVLFPRTPVEIQGRNEIMHQLSGTAYRTAGAEALAITLDSTP